MKRSADEQKASDNPDPAPIQSQRAEHVRRILLIVFGTSVGLLLSAAILMALRKPTHKATPVDYPTLRAKLDLNPLAVYQFDEVTSYRFKPFLKGIREGTKDMPLRTNSRGLLGSQEVDPNPNVKKILFLGDSVTFGTGIAFEKIFVSRMQKEAGSKYQLLNAGVPGWSTRQEISFYEKYLRDISWTAVVLCVCLNDLVEYEWVYRDEEGFQMSAEMADAGGLWELNSSMAGLRLLALRQRFAADPKIAVLNRLNNTVLQAWDVAHWKTYREKIMLPWLRQQVRPPIVIVAMPTRAQIEALAIGAPRGEVLWPQQQLAEICEQEHVVCIDPTSALVHSESPRDSYRLFSTDDLHFSEEGHAVMAEYLWPRLQESFRSATVK